jgi:3-phenylpropionate/cinnamic acid dioxygenase small subunit
MTSSRRMTRQEVEDFLYREARLLDSGQLEAWLGLFAADGIYWLPIDEQADPEREPSIIYDDATQRAKRVFQLRQGSHYTQVPPSRTVHVISNVEVEDGATGGEVTLRCNVIVYELRPGDHQGLQVGVGTLRALVGHCEYRLRWEQERWAIGLKKVVLIDRDLPLHNLTFIL